jgi:glycosyltransferase involved in cell wall biosynthesis
LIVALLPAHNEERRISDVINKAHNYVQKVIVCDDGSTDATYKKAIEAGAEVIRHKRNRGYGAALQSLFEKAQSLPAGAYVTVDADGQHESACIPALAEPILKNKADMVIGSRFLSDNGSFVPAHRRIAIRVITSLFDAATGGEFTDLQSGFRAYNNRALTLSRPSRPGMGASTEIILRATRSGLRIREVPVQIYYHEERSSPIASARQFLDVISSILMN